MEDKNKRNNLIFAGVPGDTKETWQKSENEARDMRSKMKLMSTVLKLNVLIVF